MSECVCKLIQKKCDTQNLNLQILSSLSSFLSFFSFFFSPFFSSSSFFHFSRDNLKNDDDFITSE